MALCAWVFYEKYKKSQINLQVIKLIMVFPILGSYALKLAA